MSIGLLIAICIALGVLISQNNILCKELAKLQLLIKEILELIEHQQATINNRKEKKT